MIQGLKKQVSAPEKIILSKEKRIKEIENNLELFEARCERNAKIEAIRQRNRIWRIVIRLNVGIISILCTVYAVYMQS